MMSSPYYSLGDVSRLLDVKFYRITYAHTAGKVPEPERIANKRVYQSDDVLALARYFELDSTEVQRKLEE
tara:strand:+ start:9599 stop:9808 length:210 start_codon:yes stop_codon:yes gene_type:complete